MVSIEIARTTALRRVRFGRRPRVLGLFLLAAVATLFVTGSAAAEGPPLVLSNDSIGMSGSEIEAAQAPPVPEAPSVPEAPAIEEAPLVLEAPPSIEPTPSEFVSDESPPYSDCTVAQTAAAITSFGHCVETSIRRGVGFEDSSRVCRALFPEQG